MNRRPAKGSEGWCIVGEMIQTDFVVAGMLVEGWSHTGSVALFLDGEHVTIEAFISSAYSELGPQRKMIDRWAARIHLVPKERVESWPRRVHL